MFVTQRRAKSAALRASAAGAGSPTSSAARSGEEPSDANGDDTEAFGRAPGAAAAAQARAASPRWFTGFALPTSAAEAAEARCRGAPPPPPLAFPPAPPAAAAPPPPPLAPPPSAATDATTAMAGAFRRARGRFVRLRLLFSRSHARPFVFPAPQWR